ncbi:endolytic transglycosylase MltG [Shewanella sedimentimangrovi]|uniref:Endolytic murein transglycosylase n=1 Tax=Shewanella sedimentimangrovi TaxID=2814293 RepID=A0ABX7QXQ1_9GAMM|nr:endolytic transglycosylase MltG [Shewanella sedimentimangrovi]QSX35740.1 endolytic transglycosylase MltG [Shewanella sedimentimangrovi]
MTRLLKTIATALLSLSLLAALAAYWGWQQVQEFADAPLSLDSPIELKVERGTSAKALGRQLVAQKLLADNWQYPWLLRLQPELGAIRSGLYQVEPGTKLRQLLALLVSGKTKVFSVTLVEGLTVKEWQSQLQTAAHLTWVEQPFLKTLQDNGDTSGLPEGKFFPDTYSYHAGDSVLDLLDQSHRKMLQELNSAWAQRAAGLPLKDPYELLILASIIEKETGRADERPLIAAVFVNRLQRKMRLQTDPTVIYGMGERFKGNISRKDLREATPFNTYRIDGLPPTPIAAPGRAALMAAAQPAAVNYLYFVSRNDGSHVFSVSLAEHNRAVNQFQRKAQ